MEINNLIITNCQSEEGGAIRNEGTLTITNSNLTNNINPSEDYYIEGGGAINNLGTLTIKNSNLTRNTAIAGGAICNVYSANLNITNSSLNYNEANGKGGAIYEDGSRITITHSDLSYNKALDGGALHMTIGSNITIKDSNLTHNNATDLGGSGGAIEMEDGNLTVINSNLTHNTADSGAAIDITGLPNKSFATIIGSNIKYNFARNDFTAGGAIDISDSILNITNSNITHNNANYYGGAIYNEGYMTIANSNITHNNASTGGAIYNLKIYKISDTTFDNNTPANFKINENNKIQLINTDGFIDVQTFAVITNNTVYHGNGLDELEQYTIPTGSLKVKLVLNGTNKTNNIFNIEPSKKQASKINITDNHNGIITINITTSENKAVSGISVNVTLNDGRVIATGITDETGTTNIKLPLTPGDYTITVVHKGNDIISPGNISVSISIPKIATHITAVANNGTNTHTSIDITLVDEDNSPISSALITLIDNENNQIGEGTTDLDGFVNIPVTLPVGTSDITVTYSGDGHYSF